MTNPSLSQATASRLPMPGDIFAGNVVVVAGDSAAAQAVADGFLPYACQVVRLCSVPGAKGAIVTDLREPAGIKKAFDEIEAAHGPASILVNALHCDRRMAMVDTFFDAWRDAIELEYDSPFFLATEFARRRFVAAEPGAVLNVMVDAASTSTRPAHRAAATGGLENQNRSLAMEWARDGIRVNGLACGCSDADLRDPTKAAEMAWVATWLCSPYAAYITGHTMAIHGADRSRIG
jgi:NAD(P)-dependent dehydrogenase (short-subunit alcohol dehydrogenase family)